MRSGQIGMHLKWEMDVMKGCEHGMRCSRAWCGKPPQFWGLLIWSEPGLSHVTWVHYDATMCLACLVCWVLPVLHFL